MHDKFSLSFDVIDRAETHALQKQLGLDANPWRTFPRIITSYYYLRQPDVLEQFLATCRAGDDDTQLAQLPWDLLIVDEAHNLMPSNFGDDSDLAKMLREHHALVRAQALSDRHAAQRPHPLFLRPARAARPRALHADERVHRDEKERVKQVVVRRLKSEINDLDDKAGRPRRFPYRELTPLELGLSTEEKALSATVETLRKRVKALVAQPASAGRSSPATSPSRSSASACSPLRPPSPSPGFASNSVSPRMRRPRPRRSRPPSVPPKKRLDDDLEREGRAQHAARTIGAWLQPLLGDLESRDCRVDKCLADLGLEPGDGSHCRTEERRPVRPARGAH